MRRMRLILMVFVIATAALGLVPSHAGDNGEDPVLVGIDSAGDGAVTGDPTLAPLGLDELSAYIHQPSYEKNELEFVWQLTDLQIAPPPPEIIRYLWQMTVNGVEYWIVAKTSDITTATAVADDPTGAVTHVQGAFRLRAGCSTVGIVATCHHVLWLNGVFDTANKQVRVTVPLDNPAAPDFKAGAEILPTTIEAGFQIVISDANTTDQMGGCAVYTVPSNGVPGPVDSGCE